MAAFDINIASRAAAKSFLEFVNKTGSPYHTVLAARNRLDGLGFVRLQEDGEWKKLHPGGKYYITRNHSSIMAFIVGGKFSMKKETGGFLIVGSHTDSPCLRVRPNNDLVTEGYRLLSVETYGGGLWHTWLDRGLGLAGKVVLRKPDQPYGVEERLVRIPRSVSIIPNLAIHLKTAEERKALEINPETQLRPIICSELKRQFVEGSLEKAASEPIRGLLANELSCNQADIMDLDVCLMDATEGRLAGMYEEFVESGRLDNITSTWASLESICECKDDLIRESADIYVAVSWDNEEVGSVSYTGADSITLERWLRRVLESLEEGGVAEHNFSTIIEKSFLISADSAHGVHPNYADKHQALHKPLLHKGVVIKENCNLRYTSHAITMAMIRNIAELADPPVPCQNVVVRNDSPCGSTIGPLSTARLGIRGVDIGISQWAMHSIRETCSCDDLFYLKSLISTFFAKFQSVDRKSKPL